MKDWLTIMNTPCEYMKPLLPWCTKKRSFFSSKCILFPWKFMSFSNLRQIVNALFIVLSYKEINLLIQIDIYFLSSVMRNFLAWLLIIPHATRCVGCNVFYPSLGQSVLFFFVSATPLKPFNRVSWNFVINKDILCRCAYVQEILDLNSWRRNLYSF